MNRTSRMPTFVHPNLDNTSSKVVQGTYDVVIAKEEKFITPNGKIGRARVFSRVSPEKIRNDGSGNLQTYAKHAKARISDAILRSKMPAEKKSLVLDMMTVQVKGDHSKPLTAFFSANKFHDANEKFRLPEQKQVRFMDTANVEIPRNKPAQAALPKEVILPELPQEF